MSLEGDLGLELQESSPIPEKKEKMPYMVDSFRVGALTKRLIM